MLIQPTYIYIYIYITLILKLEFLLLRFAFLLLLPLPLVSILQGAMMLTRQSASFWNQNIKENIGSQNTTYLRHHVTEVLFLVAKLLFLSRFFIPVALSEEVNPLPFWLGREKKKQPTISTEQRHQAEWSLLGCQNIIHGFQFLRLNGDVHLVWFLILKQIHLPPNLTQV